MKCYVCGKDTPKEFHWKSAYEELEARVYCSTECVQKDNEFVQKSKHNAYMKARWLEIKYAMFEALELLGTIDLIEDFEKDYPNVADKIHHFEELLRKDYE